MGGGIGRPSAVETMEQDEIIEVESHDNFTETLRLQLSRLIVFCEGADESMQKDVAERLANEAVNHDRQVHIVQLGGLRLLLPLARSPNADVKRLAAHTLANLSVDSQNQIIMAESGVIPILVELLECKHESVNKQAAKALANLAINNNNKVLIAQHGAIEKLIDLASNIHPFTVRVEALAALANLAVNGTACNILLLTMIDKNEVQILSLGLLRHIKDVLQRHDWRPAEEIDAQCARALRNLTVNETNKSILMQDAALLTLLQYCVTRAKRSDDANPHPITKKFIIQSTKALENLAPKTHQFSNDCQGPNIDLMKILQN